MANTIKIKLVRSPISTPEHHKRVVKGLGLRKLNQIVVRLPDQLPGGDVLVQLSLRGLYSNQTVIKIR